MAYADYGFYKNTYKGTLSVADFERLSERASDYIDSRTDYVLNKSGIPPDMELRVKKACCAAADCMRESEKGGVRTSERIGDHSVSYAVSDQRTTEQKLDAALRMYLSDLIRTVRWI